MKIALAQINTTVGDLAGNVARCLAAAGEARAQGADLVVLPEMAVTGYPPRDILYDASFVAAAQEATADLARRTPPELPVIAGTVVPGGPRAPHHPGLYNAAMLLENGAARLAAAKRLLPTYDVFYERRWFTPGPALPPLDVAGGRVGILICEDLWDEGYAVHPPAELHAAGAEFLVALSASPFRQGVMEERLYHARRPGCPVIHVNLIGAADELIFDGQSFAVDAAGRLIARLPAFEEAVAIVDLATPTTLSHAEAPPERDLFHALALGIRDFARKNGIEHAFLGLSGGVDSAVVAILAVAALGAQHVTAVAIPSRYSDPRSTTSAEALARALGAGFEVIPLEPLHAATEAALGDRLGSGIAAENVQARLRALILMALVNTRGGLLLNTSNKTELALGYGTLYGDLAGSLCPIGDLTKPQVYALARWLNDRHTAIPDFILARPPSAELKPDQVDPFDYPKIAPELERLVQQNRSNGALRRSEHKRWHMGVILKVSAKAFGTGRLIPITRR